MFPIYPEKMAKKSGGTETLFTVTQRYFMDIN